MQLRDRLVKLVETLGMTWAGEGLADKATAVAAALAAQASDDPGVPIRLLQVLLLDPDLVTTRSAPPVEWVLRSIREQSETLGGAAPVGWCRLIALGTVQHMVDEELAAAALMTGALRSALARPMPSSWGTCVSELAATANHAWGAKWPRVGNIARGARWPDVTALVTTAFKDAPPALAAFEALHQHTASFSRRVENVVEVFGAPIELIWRAQAGWSERLGLAWDEIEDTGRRAQVIMDDLVQAAPACDATTSFVLRTLSAEGVDLSGVKTHGAWLKQTRDALEWQQQIGAPEQTMPEALRDLVSSCAVGLPLTAVQVGVEPYKNTARFSGREWYLGTIRERLLARHWDNWVGTEED